MYMGGSIHYKALRREPEIVSGQLGESADGGSSKGEANREKYSIRGGRFPFSDYPRAPVSPTWKTIQQEGRSNFADFARLQYREKERNFYSFVTRYLKRYS